MFADTRALFFLLVYSLIVGASLGVFYDSVMLAADMFFPPKANKKAIVRILPHNEYEANRVLTPIDKKLQKRDVALFVFDIAFFTVSALTVIIMLYHLNYGQIRFFSLAFALFGFLLYRKTVGKPIRIALQKLLTVLLKGIDKAINAAFKPLKWIFIKISAPVFDRVRRRNAIKKARKYLLLMEQSEHSRKGNGK